MAQLRAPYHNGMRLGQGFNSYTQQICLDNAVLPDNDPNRDRVRPYYVSDTLFGQKGDQFLLQLKDSVTKEADISLDPRDEHRPKLQPWVKPQIVTYSSRFVDKLQDVTESMNISGALSIQTATVGGKGSGSYVDSDKFKDSDINFHLQVKVVNQIQKPEDYTLFNNIHNIDQKDFTGVYGDCFISGWEEGGEMNAIVSMKVTDKSKIFNIKADLQASINAGVKVEAQASVDIRKENTNKSTETTIAVNWAGGGSIKAPEEQWTIEAMTKAAAAFPDLVAMTPQRTYAILTKYTALESFQRQTQHYSILDYENASIYTNMLMEHFMEYKMMWKQISQATVELQRGTARIEWSEESDEVASLANVLPIPDKQQKDNMKKEAEANRPKITEGEMGKKKGITEGGEGEEKEVAKIEVTAELEDRLTKAVIKEVKDEIKKELEIAEAVKKGKEDDKLEHAAESVLNQVAIGAISYQDKDTKKWRLKYPPFDANIKGLVRARKVCRSEMAKIVNEVDLITKWPKAALDQQRDDFFLEPEIYRRLLPIVRTWTADMLGDAAQAEAPVILGFSRPADGGKPLPDVLILKPKLKELNENLMVSIKKVKRKAKNYRMLGITGTHPKDVMGHYFYFNDLETLDPTYRPTLFAVWVNDGDKIVQGVQVNYANGEKKSHGYCDEHKECFWIELNTEKGAGSEIIFDIRFQTATVQVTPKADTPTSSGAPTPESDSSASKKVEEPPKKEEAKQTGTPALPAPQLKTETVITSVAIVTSKYRILDTADPQCQRRPLPAPEPTPPAPVGPANPSPMDTAPDDKSEVMTPNTLKPSEEPPSVFSRPDVGLWSLRGFFGFQKGVGTNTRFLTMGVVYGKDRFVPRPAAPEISPLCKTFFGIPGVWTAEAQTTAKPTEYPAKTIQADVFNLFGARFQMAGRFIMGDCAVTTEPAKKDGYFNHMWKLQLGYVLKSVTFGAAAGKLTGLKVTWANGEVDKVGNIPEKSWVLDVSPPVPPENKVVPRILISAKITMIKGSGADANKTNIHTVEFIRSENEYGELPPWLLDLSAQRYLGDAVAHTQVDPALVETAPDYDGAVWSVRGFYGAVSPNNVISALGVVWGRDK